MKRGATMIAIAKLETLRKVAAAMRRTQGWNEVWWEIPAVETPLRIGECLGWLYRLSTTQVHWTEAGVAAFKEFRPPHPSPRFSVDHVVDLLAGKAPQKAKVQME
ncbi:MAG: hypothetical protein GY719_35095 [bacterium]|nr:hypothetical protein [bacterium]